VLSLAHLPREVVGAVSDGLPAPTHAGGDLRPLVEVEAEHIRRVVALCDGNKTRAAELLGISRLTLRNKLGAPTLPGAEPD
jgi:DNA-binding NtrC family response regulator